MIDSESGITSTYYYDFIDRLCHYTEEADGYSLSMKYSFNSMDAVTFIEEIVDGSRRSTSITYDADQRVASIRKGTVKEGYTYDANGNITDVISVGSITTYTYDTQNQLIREDDPPKGRGRSMQNSTSPVLTS